MNDSQEKDYVDAEEIVEKHESQSLQTVTPLSMQVQTEMSPADLRAEIQKQTEMRGILVEYVKSQMIPEHHYYSFNPGAKPVLTQDGAYLINGLFKAIPGPVKTTIERSDDGHFTVYAEAVLFNQNGAQIATGDGMCSTRESKYAYRKGERVCPTCGEAAIIKGKKEYGGGWVCFAKKGGCGAKFSDGDETIESQQTGRIENPDLADVENTVLKMACKRAGVAATRKLPLVSELFTQDIGEEGQDSGRGPSRGGQQRRQGQPRAEQAGGGSVARAVEVAKRLLENGISDEDLAAQFLPDGVSKFSEMTEQQAAEALPAMAEVLNAKLQSGRKAASGSVI